MKLLIEKIKRKKSELEVKKTSKVFSSSNKDSKNKLKDTKETSFMKQKKLNYEKFIFKKDDIPQLFKSFIIHFLYTYKKLLRGKVFWIVSFITSIIFMFMWRSSGDIDNVIQFGPFITTTIFGMIIIIVVPVLTAYFVSKAYREERDRGSLIFIVTKKDHKSLIYFSKYISAIMATWTWLIVYQFFILFWISFKIILVYNGNLNLIAIFGDNPSFNNFFKMLNINFLMILLSLFVIVFWGSIFFLLSRVLNSRGIVMASMSAPMIAVFFPMIGNILGGAFDTNSDSINNIKVGKHDFMEYTSNESVYVNFTLDNEINNRYITRRFMKDLFMDEDSLVSKWKLETNIPNKKPTINDIEWINYENTFKQNIMNYDITNSLKLEDNGPKIENNNKASSVTTHANGPIPNNGWYAPKLEHSFKTLFYEKDLPFSDWEIKGNNFSIIKKNNSAGWLSFLNPVYYTASLIEQPQKLLIPSELSKTGMLDQVKLLSMLFGGRHNAKMSIDNTYENIKNKRQITINPPSNVAPSGYDNSLWGNIMMNKYLYGYNIVYLNAGLYRTKENDISKHGYIQVPTITPTNIGQLTYYGMEYWIHPAGITFMLMFGGLGLSWIAIRVNSRHDLSRL